MGAAAPVNEEVQANRQRREAATREAHPGRRISGNSHQALSVAWFRPQSRQWPAAETGCGCLRQPEE
jgi:hypothetical protein